MAALSIVVVNASTDDSVELARKAGFDVIERGVNDGCAAAANVGIRASEGEIVTAMNADIRADACGDFLSLITNFLDPKVAVAAPTLVLTSGEIPDSAREVPRRTSWSYAAGSTVNAVRSAPPTRVLCPWSSEPAWSSAARTTTSASASLRPDADALRPDGRHGPLSPARES